MQKKKKANTIPKLNRKKGLYLLPTPGKGRGVFCTHDIKKGEILEVTPAILLNEKATDTVDETILVDYTFTMDGLSPKTRTKAKIKKTVDASSVVLGILAFCNHDEKPNATVLFDEHAGTVYYILKAIRDIPRDTEICTSYGDTWFDDRK